MSQTRQAQVSVFVDTNIFLHYPPLKDIDWCEKCAAETVELVVCMTVIHELDAKKSHPQLSKRANTAIRSIREAKASGSQLRPGVTLAIFNEEIRASDFPSTLSIDSPDDRIVHLALLYQEKTSKAVAVATSDLGMELRAEVRRLTVIRFDETLRKPSPEDDLTKKNRELERQLLTHQNRCPILRLFISDTGIDSGGPFKFEVAQQWKILCPEKELADLRTKFPYERKNPYLDRFPFAQPSEESIQSYNDKLDAYYVKYREYIAQENELASLAARTNRFALWLSNQGRAFANKVEVTLVFPDPIVGIAELDSEIGELLTTELRPPNPPEKPKNGLESYGFLDHHLITRVPQLQDHFKYLPNVADPESAVCNVGEFGTDKGRELSCSINMVRHDRKIKIGDFFVIWKDHSVNGKFPIRFEISAEELPERVIHAIPVVVSPRNIED